MEKRILNISFYKSGSGSVSARLNIPKPWLAEIGVTERSKDIVAEFDGEELKIRKAKPEDYII